MSHRSNKAVCTVASYSRRPHPEDKENVFVLATIYGYSDQFGFLSEEDILLLN